MSVTDTTEKRFESDIESVLLSSAGGYTKGTDVYDSKLGLYKDMESQDTYSSLFEDQSKYNAVMNALADVLYREMRSKHQ